MAIKLFVLFPQEDDDILVIDNPQIAQEIIQTAIKLRFSRRLSFQIYFREGFRSKFIFAKADCARIDVQKNNFMANT